MSSRGLKLFLSKPLAEWLLRDFHRSDYSQVCMRQLRSESPGPFSASAAFDLVPKWVLKLAESEPQERRGR